jgi:hypothetical protein
VIRRVVRAGDANRVAPHSRSGYVARLLTHLEEVGFDGAPRWLGRSDDGWDLLSHVDGAVLEEPPYDLDDDQLVACAALVRRFHDATAGSELCEDQETVCHNDLGPHNTVFRARRPVALIDFDDDVGPGRRAVDFADGVWSYADLTSSDVPVSEQARRVVVMCRAYPGMSPALVVTELRAQFERARSNHAAAGRQGPLAVFDGLVTWLDRNGPRIARGS